MNEPNPNQSAQKKKFKWSYVFYSVIIVMGVAIGFRIVQLIADDEFRQKTLSQQKEPKELPSHNQDNTVKTSNKNSSWEKEFTKYRMDNNADVSQLTIDESVLYIYVKNMTDDLDVYSRMYTMQFQKAYKENTGRSNVSTLVYYNGDLIKEYDANSDGLK